MDDGSGWTKWYFEDARGRLSKEQKHIDGGGSSYVTQWAYDKLDRVVGTVYPGGSSGQAGEEVSTGYDAGGGLYSVVGTDGYLLSTRYDSAGRVLARSLGNGRQAGYDYYDWTAAGGQGRLERIKAGTAASPKLLQHLHYAYDLVGNVTAIQDYKVTGGVQTQSFSYDEREPAAERGGNRRLGGAGAVRGGLWLQPHRQPDEQGRAELQLPGLGRGQRPAARRAAGDGQRRDAQDGAGAGLQHAVRRRRAGQHAAVGQRGEGQDLAQRRRDVDGVPEES